MKAFNIYRGGGDTPTLIGRVLAHDKDEARSTLNAYRNGLKSTAPGEGVPTAHVTWAHPNLSKLHAAEVSLWQVETA